MGFYLRCIKSINLIIFKINLTKKMGSNNSKTESLHYEPKDWEEVERSVLYEVMRSRRGQQANLYHFNLKDEFDIDDQVDIYHKRKSQANWVQVLGANLTTSGFGFCGTQENVCVLTQPIPILLNSISRLNKQQSSVVLYNALKGYSDVSRIIVPGVITDKMIGFNKVGQTKVWVNENFGMNHPGNHLTDIKLDEVVLLNNLVAAVRSKLDLSQDFLVGVKNSRTIGNALNFIRANSGVSESVLENNQINVVSYTGKSQLQVLRDTTPIQTVVPQTTTISGLVQPQTQSYVQQQQVQSSYVQPQVQSYVQQNPTYVPQQAYYQPQVGQQVVQSAYRNQPASFVQPAGTSSAFVGTGASFQSSYQVPRYAESINPNKFSFNGAQ